MEPAKILQSDLLDILFDNRNKAYGAYELRKGYNQRIVKALGITTTLLLLAFGTTFALRSAGSVAGNSVVEVVVHSIPPAELPANKPVTPPPPPVKAPPPPKVEMIKFTPPVIKKDIAVKEQDMPPVADVQDTRVGTITQTGIKTDLVNVPTPPDNDKTGIIALPAPKEDPDAIPGHVDIEAKVDPRAWRRHLEKYLQPLADNAGSEGMEPGIYTIQVRFLVEKDGSITEVQALTDPGHDLKKGVEEVVRKGPHWEAGIRDGRAVRSYHTQPVVFQIAEQ